jgi:hypothetical protein
MTPDLLDRLRDDAQTYRPDLPPGLHRRVQGALAAAPAPGARQTPLSRWLLTATTLAAIVALVTVLYRQSPPSTPITTNQPRHQPAPALRVKPPVALAQANPLSLTQHYIEAPLQTELQNLLTDLTHARQTITSALPSAAKRLKPTTTPQGA